MQSAAQFVKRTNDWNHCEKSAKKLTKLVISLDENWRFPRISAVFSPISPTLPTVERFNKFWLDV
jgi:hypothetical protein